MANEKGNSNDYLSQEEIDALLNQSNVADSGSTPADESLHINDYLTPMEQDALGEIGNISFGSAATALSTLLGQKVEITTPEVSAVAKERLKSEFPKPHVAVHVKYVEGFQGVNLLVIKTADAQVIADLMLGGDGTNVSGNAEDLSEFHISAVQEAMNQMMGSAATSMSTVFNRMVNISPPGIDILDVSNGEGTSSLPEDQVMITVSFRLKIGSLIDSSIMQLLTVPFSKEMVEGLIGSAGGDSEPLQQNENAANDEPIMSEEELAALNEQLAAGFDMPYESKQADAAPPTPGASEPNRHNDLSSFQHPVPEPRPTLPNRSVNVQPVEYTQFDQSGPIADGDVNLNLLMDIPLKVTVELGRTKKQVREILEFTQGSIIELDKLAGEPVDILVNDKLIAKGEVVVIDENFGVRVIDIVSQADRLKNIK